MRGVNHARSLGAVADTRHCRHIFQGRFCESLQWPIKYARAAKNRRGFQRLWVTLVFLLLLIPSNAFGLTAGDMGVIWGPNPVGRWGSGQSDEQGVICVADNAFNAALVTCGVMTNDERLTADAKAKLSNASSGGNFYTFAQCFSCFQGNDGYNYPSWNRAATGVVDSMANLFGPENVWWGLYESYLLTSAKEDLETVLNGGSLGGGSGGGSGSTGTLGYAWPMYGNRDLYSKTNFTYGGTWTGSKNVKDFVWNIQLDTNVHDKLVEYLAKYPYVFIYMRQGTTYFNGGSNQTLHLYVSKVKPHVYNVTRENDRASGTIDAMKNTSGYDSHFVLTTKATCDTLTKFTFNTLNYTSDAISANSGFWYLPLNYFDDETQTGVGGDPVIPPTNWPDSEPTTPKTKPVVPDPPDVTAPTVPTYDPKSYTNPVITTGTGDTYNSTTTNIYNYNYETSNASGQDIIPYLQAILAALNNITRNIATYLINVQNLINDVIEANDNNASQIVAKLTSIITAINNASTTINSGIGELDTDINTGLGEIYELIGDFQGAVHDEFKSLKTYLKSLFQWLANQFDFTFDGGDFDDSSILYWLRRIYYKLGAGRVNTRPTDPVADPVGIGDWLAQLFRNFLGGLLGIGGEALDAVLDALDDLRNKFPFSIPWDLAAILGLLVADPVAPNFDVPQYTITNEGLQQVATYHIDLSVFDDVMVGVRTMETLVFAFCLAFKTDFFKGLLTVHGGE